MQVSKAERGRLQSRIDKILTSEYPWAKEKLLASRRRIHHDVPMEDTNLWLRFRNALDRIATVQSYLILGQVPDPPLNRLETPTEVPEGYTLPPDDDPDAILDYARYLFVNTAIEGWRFTADLAINRLEYLLVEPEYIGDQHIGQTQLEEARKHEAEGRVHRSANSRDAIAHFEHATNAAIQGINRFRKATASEKIDREREPLHRALLYTSWTMAVVALLPLVIPRLAEKSWAGWSGVFILAAVLLQVARPLMRLVFSRRKAKKTVIDQALAAVAKKRPGG